MSPLWHPLSTILLADPPCYATAALLKLLLGPERKAELVYAGDRMWPALHHGQRFVVRPPGSGGVSQGSAVLVCPDGIPELLRVRSVSGDRLDLVADADSSTAHRARTDDVIGVAQLPSVRYSRRLARFRRLSLDLREAWQHGPDPAADPAATVLDKYDQQAAFYVDSSAPELEPGLADRIRRHVPERERVLVIGSGVGRECFALARAGWRVTGVDFAPAMIEEARRGASLRELEVEFLLGDIRNQPLERSSYAAVLFTYDVYSFLPGQQARREVLQRLRAILRPAGHVFLSARRIRSTYERFILGQQWVAGRGRGEWGDSHTRWIATDGTLRRSYVRAFTPAQLEAEVVVAGFRLVEWQAGHGLLRPLV